jgi:ribosomal protein L20
MVRVKRGNVARKRRKKNLVTCKWFEERILYYLE